jgi:hypothetical protein
MFRAKAVLLLSLCFSVVAALAAPVSAAPVVVGYARFTVITANLIRLEYQPSGQFVDLPSTFAAERQQKASPPFNVVTAGAATVITTSAMTLTYSPDGHSFDPTNLNILVTLGSAQTRWVPGIVDPENLGGTIRTLDGAMGPEDLGQGVLSRSGWSLVDDSLSPLLTPDGWVESRTDGQKAGLDWYFFGYGGNYRSALSSLMTISGPVPLPRKYALGVWYSRWWPWAEDDYKNIVAKYGTEGFPLDNIVMDMDWHKDGWTGWSWNTKLLPDAPGLLSWYHAHGLHATVNLHPADGVAPHEDQYASFMKALNLDPASEATVPFDAGSKAYMTALFSTVLDPLRKDGVDFWWLDWQQYPDTVSIPDLTNLFWLNTLLYNYEAEDGQRGMSFSRWAGWGDQRHPIHFSGDANTGFRMLAFEVPFTATAGNVGCFFWSHDIGGFGGGRNEESYARWCQFGAAAPVLRTHSTRDATMDRAPWGYPKWAEDSMRISFRLRSQLFPYIYTSAAEACSQNIPLDRPVYLDLPGIEPAYHNGQEFMLGDNILSAPVASAGAGPGHVSSQTVWLPPTPAGYWYNLLTGERAAQSTSILAAYDIDEFPIFARGGVPIPMQPYTQRMGTSPVQTLRIRCYPGADGQIGKSSLYEDDGVTTAYETGSYARTNLLCQRQGLTVKVVVFPTVGTFSGQPQHRNCIFELPDISLPASATLNGKAAKVVYDPATFTASVTVNAVPLGQTTTLIVAGCRPTGWDDLHDASVRRRVKGSVDSLQYTGPLSGLLNAALTAAGSNISEQSAAMASIGLGVVHKNISTNFYPEAYQDEAFVPFGVTTGNSITLPGGNLEQTPASGLSAEPITPVAGYHTRISFQIGNQTYILPPLRPGVGSDDNVAISAVATASSVQGGSPSGPEGAIDGFVGGYPDDSSQEWASNGEKAGAWLQLDWKTPQTVDRIWLYDRPNTDDQITSGTITFSDGSTLPFGALPNDASQPVELVFPPKTIASLKLTVTGTSPTTQNIGLSEIAVFKAGSHPTR